MLSKSNGLSFETHSKSVARIAEFLAKKILSTEYLNEHLKKIILSALIHDIGKCNKNFQDFLIKKYNLIIDDDENPIYLFHQELSWAIAMCILNKSEYESALNAIYWHHAKPKYEESKNNNDYISNILNKITDDDIINIYNNLSLLIPDNLKTLDDFKNTINKYKQSSEKYPNYYSNLNKENPSNRNAIIYRSILIASDRISSKLSVQDAERTIVDDDFCEKLVTNTKEIVNYILPTFYNPNRLNLQLQITNDCNINNTTIVKAPAGFGKTFIGLLWTIKRKNKLLWVCPRNIVVESVYDSILKEIKNLQIENISVELFITGHRKKCTHENVDIFNSDIVVTNIDNFLSPIAKNRFGLWSADILSRDVVFDEFHEFICDNALFSGFIEIMKIRHNIAKCNTVLLSATPSLFNFLWDGIFKKTKILPDNNFHYPAAHNVEYNVNFIDESNLVNEKNSLIMTNSIHNAQLKKKELNMDLLVHSNFLDEDKSEIFKTLYDNYGKSSPLNDKPSVSSAPIIQASMDISFLKMFISLLSPEQFLQVIGRCDRWGEYIDPSIFIFKLKKNKSEQKAINMLYDKNLNDNWYTYLENEVNKHNNKMILNQLYEIYNKFNTDYEKEIKEYIEKQYKLSIESLSNIKPIKYVIEPSENKKISKKANYKKFKNNLNENITTWRTTDGNSMFVTYPYYDAENNSIFDAEYTPAFSVNLRNYGIETQFEEDDDFRRNIKKVIKRLINDGVFKYPKRFCRGFDISTLIKYAKDRNDCPYVAFNKKYSKEYGLAKNSIYDK